MVTTFMIVSLLRIQFSMEDPFDEVGPDDINLGMIKEVCTDRGVLLRI